MVDIFFLYSGKRNMGVWEGEWLYGALPVHSVWLCTLMVEGNCHDIVEEAKVFAWVAWVPRCHSLKTIN